MVSLLAAAAVGAAFAALVGLPLMRLSGLAAGIATFGVLEITHNVLRYYEKIGPGTTAFSSVPETTDLLQATIGGLIAVWSPSRTRTAVLAANCGRPRGSGGGARGRDLGLPPASALVRALGCGGQASPAACTSTCCR